MASKNQNGGNTGTVNVSELVANATSAQSTAQENLLSARQSLIGNIESMTSEIATIDNTLGTMGFSGDLPAPNISGGAPAPAPKRRGRPRKASTASAPASTDGVRGTKNMPLEDAICHALAADSNGAPNGDGLSLTQIVEGVTGIGYTFSGKQSNWKTLVSQRMGELTEGGYVEQVAIEGRSRGLPFRLTTGGRQWVKANPIG